MRFEVGHQALECGHDGVVAPQIAVLDRRRNDPGVAAGLGTAPRAGDGKRRGPLAEGGQAVGRVVDLPLGEDDQRVPGRGQDLDAGLERPEVRPLAIDREDTEPGQVDPVQTGKELIGGHEVERPAHPMAELEHHTGIGVVAVVGRDQDPVAPRQEWRQTLDARELDRVDPEDAAKFPVDVKPPQPAPERVDPGRIELVGQLIGQRQPAHTVPRGFLEVASRACKGSNRADDRAPVEGRPRPETLTYLWSRHAAH